jgi:hypothetical protein
MSVQLIAASVWSALTDAARRSKKPAYAAVASFGKGAADLLRLRSAEEWAGRLKTLAEMPVVKGVPSKIPCQTVLAPTALPSARTGHRNSQPAISQCG